MDAARLGEKAAAGRRLNLLIVPGFMGTAAPWRPFLSSLGPDMTPEFWFAERMPVSEVVAGLRRCLRRGRSRPLVALGYSQGVRLLWLALRQGGALPDALILVSGRPPISDTLVRARRRAVDRRRAALARRLGTARFLDHWRAVPVIRSQSAIAPQWRARRRAERLGLAPAQIAVTLDDFGAGRVRPTPPPDLSDLPVLGIVGARDRQYCDLRPQWQSLLPALQWSVIANAGHAPHFEQPVATASAARRFLSDAGLRNVAPVHH